MPDNPKPDTPSAERPVLVTEPADPPPVHDSLVGIVIDRFDRTDAKLDGIRGQLAEHSTALVVLGNRVERVEGQLVHVEAQAEDAARAVVAEGLRAAAAAAAATGRAERVRGETRRYWGRWAAGVGGAALVGVVGAVVALLLQGVWR